MMNKVSYREKELIERSFILGVASADSRRTKKPKKPKKVASASNVHHHDHAKKNEKESTKDLYDSPQRSWSKDLDVMHSEVSIFMNEINMNVPNLSPQYLSRKY